MSLKQQVLSTMKSRDIEGPFELYFARTPGYLWALLFKRLGVHPITVTVLSMVLGCAVGYFFYSSSLQMNIIGMLLLILANWYDCADGQLARMTNQKTLIGRILDGFAGDMWFFCIYLGLALRMTPDYGIWIWLLLGWAGMFCHAHQCSLADYYRNAHLYFTGVSYELDRSADIESRYRSLDWKKGEWFEKLYLFFYASYTRSQENPTPQLQKLLKATRTKYGNDLPAALRQQYRKNSKPLMPLCQLLTFDARLITMFICLLVGLPWLYPLLEVTAFEALRIYTNLRHESMCKEVMRTQFKNESREHNTLSTQP